MICGFCKGDGMLYESPEYADDLYRFEEIFPIQGFNEITCPVCGGTGEVLDGEEKQGER